jgi:transcriptional regulator with XRE-family HTH domain
MDDRNEAEARHKPSDAAADRARALGAAIRRARGDRSQSELARRLEVTQSTVSIWESGDRVPFLEQMLELEDALGVPRGRLATEAGFVGANSAPLPEAVSNLVLHDDSVSPMLDAAMLLGLGVRLTNELLPVDGEPDTFEEVWLLELSASAPQETQLSERDL